MSRTLRCKTYLSDEGYGHIVRQRAIKDELERQHPDISFLFQTHKHFDALKRIIEGIEAVDKFNNITWFKTPSGSPDVSRIKKEYTSYIENSEEYIEEEIDQKFRADFIISDFVYESFEVAKRMNIPSFGVAHFTWDWFFSKLYPPPLSTAVIDRFFSQAEMAERIYFPPFTPEEILHQFKGNSLSVPLILRSTINHRPIKKVDALKIMIIDSGAGVLRTSIEMAMKNLNKVSDCIFYLSEAYKGSVEHVNVRYINKDHLLVDYINEMDLVIGRAGFNTISECIGLRTPMLLLGEAMNPEMSENIINLKKEGLGSFIGMDTFQNQLHEYLPDFMRNEYNSIKQNMIQHSMPTNGAEVIAQDILKRVI